MAPRRPKSTILAVADDISTAAILDKQLGFATHKTKADVFEFGTKTELNTLRKQMDMYKNSLQDSLYTYTHNLRFKNRVNDVKIVAKQFIPRGTSIKTLCGQTAVIYPENIIKGVNDFSILKSSKNKKDLLFLGPAAYVNHSCSPNTEWVPRGEGVWCAKAIKNIQIGTEITTDYGPSYFGEDNVDCECEIHIDEVDRENNVAEETDTVAIELQEESTSNSKESHGVTDTVVEETITDDTFDISDLAQHVKTTHLTDTVVKEPDTVQMELQEASNYATCYVILGSVEHYTYIEDVSIDKDQNNEVPNHETNVNVSGITDKSMQNNYGFM